MQTEIQKDEYGKAIPNEYHELLATWNVTDVSHTTATAWNKHMRQGLIDDYATIAVFEISSNEKRNESLPIESLSCAFAIAAILAALGQFLNVKMHHVLRLISKSSKINAGSLNLPPQITTLLVVVFSTYYSSTIFISSTS